jgi:hypothetical protein
MERMLDKEHVGLAKRAKRAAAKIKGDQLREIYLEDLSEERTQLTQTFPGIVRSSFFAQCMSGFETYLLRAAETHRKQNGIALTMRDLNGDGISKANTYFTKVAKLPFPHETAHWLHLSHLGKIRNAVVHADAIVAPDKIKGIKDFVSIAFPEIAMSANGKLTFSPLACAKLIEICDAFLKEFRRRLKLARSDELGIKRTKM